jgi:hypothetical protein
LFITFFNIFFSISIIVWCTATIHPVCLPPTFAPGITAVGEKILAVGWGMTEAGRLSDTLRQLELPVVEPERCRDVYGVAFGDKQVEMTTSKVTIKHVSYF